MADSAREDAIEGLAGAEEGFPLLLNLHPMIEFLAYLSNIPLSLLAALTEANVAVSAGAR